MIRKSAKAELEINEIAAFIARDSVEAALKWLSNLDDFFGRIRRAPGMGTARQFLGDGVRSVAFGEYLVFFRRVANGIEIVRVIHGKRRWRSVYKKED